MGKVCFSKILRYTCLAAITVAAAFVVAITFANPVTADPNGGAGNDRDLKEWDTDNLARWIYSSGRGFDRVGAKNYRIPYHNYSASGYKERVPAKACVAYNVRWPPNGATVLRYRLLPQSETTGDCPSGYSQVTHACRYQSYVVVDYSAPGDYRSVPAKYEPVPSNGTCERKTVTKANGGCTIPLACGNHTVRWAGSKTPLATYNIGLCRHSSGSWYLGASCTATTIVDAHPGCKWAVADAFFQTGGDTGAVNDFPVASYGSESEAASVSAERSDRRAEDPYPSGCPDEEEERSSHGVRANTLGRVLP